MRQKIYHKMIKKGKEERQTTGMGQDSRMV